MITVDTAKEWIDTLSHSQGFYGRMYRDLEDNDNWDKFVDILNNSNVVDMLDMVMLIEGWRMNTSIAIHRLTDIKLNTYSGELDSDRKYNVFSLTVKDVKGEETTISLFGEFNQNVTFTFIDERLMYDNKND